MLGIARWNHACAKGTSCALTRLERYLYPHNKQFCVAVATPKVPSQPNASPSLFLWKKLNTFVLQRFADINESSPIRGSLPSLKVCKRRGRHFRTDRKLVA